MATSDQLLVVIDPLARRTDGESVRIAKDVLSAGAASTKVCLPEGPEEFARALERRGSRRPVVIGDDRALLRAVSVLHRQRELATCALSLVPVGGGGSGTDAAVSAGAGAGGLSLARSLGVPTGAVAAARAVLDGVERRLDLLVDDSDGVVLGAVGIPSVPLPSVSGAVPGAGGCGRAGGFWRTCGGIAGGGHAVGPVGSGTVGSAEGAGGGGIAAGSGGKGSAGVTAPSPWLRTRRLLLRTFSFGSRPARAADHAECVPSRLRVEVDGVLLVDLDQPVRTVSVTPGGDGSAEVEARPASMGAGTAPLRAVGRRVTVSGADFRYASDSVVAGPVRTRTWTVREGAWGLTLPG
ncbi:diacylglycerol kinase [Streptomyces poonensis]|uniref:Diacylglycerol kinase n=1 Tax=Streptomyces poonensis TaxID=68255 RepID=A0A918UIS2_9ACTN|nr:diacylglycerol kinase [Streptomyces poonensis]GGZ13345.1 diacylglycerol kinase [Streptomyces poonensis]GLJ91195.1 diacylglycerol kinase [Streptomyces poonensis]